MTENKQEQYKQTIRCSKCGSLDVRTNLQSKTRICRKCGNVVSMTK